MGRLPMNLKRRLRALEQIAVPSGDYGCEACGYEPGSRLEFKVSFGDESDEGPDECPGCRRPLILRFSFDSPLGIDLS